MTTATDLVGTRAKAWLSRGRDVEEALGRAVQLRDRTLRELKRAIAQQRVDLAPNTPVNGMPGSPLVQATAFVLEPSPTGGIVEIAERCAPLEFHLAPVAREAQGILVQLRLAIPAAGRTAGRLRFALTGQTRKIQATQALDDVVRLVNLATSEGLDKRCLALVDQPPRDPVPTPFQIDPSYVLKRIGTNQGLHGPTGSPKLLTHTELVAARELVEHGSKALRSRPALVGQVRTVFVQLQNRMVTDQLKDIPVKALRDATNGRVRFKSLEDDGYTSVADVLRAGTEIVDVHGISEIAAKQVVAAAQQVEKAVRDDLRFRIDLNRGDKLVTRLLTHLHGLLAYDAAFAGKGDELQAAVDFLRPLTALPTHARTVALFSKKAIAGQLTADVVRWVEWYHRSGLQGLLPTIAAPRGVSVAPGAVWRDFETRSPEYYAALGRIVDLKMDDEAAAGFMPREIVEKVHALDLDDSFLRVSLRGYQSFGARYALVQRKVILGDEMGLGKTIQAIAVMAHLRAGGKTHFLVVCPASVIINWGRELKARSTLRAFHVHGLERTRAWRAWQRQGGVAVTTFDTLRTLETPQAEIALLTVDEAHFVKNPTTIRARQVVGYVRRAERTLFMTGTPMENRVDEFKQLIDYLQPEVGRRVSAADGIAGGRRFRARVAPVYLRRNTEDVLQELPELVQTDEWEEFSPQELRAYRTEVRSGSFMGMRRVAFVGHPKTSAKLARLHEIVNEASGNHTKVIVFSYFRDVLGEVMTSLGRAAIGPLTGGLSAPKRQQLVDEFTRAKGPAVLVSQIQAGGVGLNMQAGSVVVLCEPQVKPSLEAQAIARAHRMGQVRTVQVHRLLITDSVDQRMLEILDSKQQLFDEYARGSAVADLSPEAVDVSEKKLAREVVAAEQERMALELAKQLDEQYADDEGDETAV